MEHSVKTIPGTWYTITSTAPATVTELIQGETANHATLKKSGTASFRPSTTQITVNTEGKFTVLPSKAPGAPFLGTGGNEQFTDEQAAQLQTLAANSADLTAHTENTEIHVTAAERESWNRTSGNFKVVTEWDEARPIILEDRTAYLPLLATNELSNLWLEPPTPMPETFVATLEFSSGETETRYRGTGITWSGDDVVNGVFVPQANTRYSCVFYYTGYSFCGKVSAERYLSTHVSDTSAHITEDERESWNEKQFTEKEKTILKRGVERDFLTRNNTYVFVADENDPNNTLTNRPPLPDMEDEGKYALKAILNKEVVKEWLGIEASSSSEPMSDKWLVIGLNDTGIETMEYTDNSGIVYTAYSTNNNIIVNVSEPVSTAQILAVFDGGYFSPGMFPKNSYGVTPLY